MNNHGGYRSGSGRKSNQKIHDLRALIDAQVSTDIWCILIHSLVREAGKGNTRAIQLLFHYRFGDPNAVEPHDELRELLQRALRETLEDKRNEGARAEAIALGITKPTP